MPGHPSIGPPAALPTSLQCHSNTAFHLRATTLDNSRLQGTHPQRPDDQRPPRWPDQDPQRHETRLSPEAVSSPCNSARRRGTRLPRVVGGESNAFETPSRPFCGEHDDEELPLSTACGASRSRLNPSNATPSGVQRYRSRRPIVPKQASTAAGAGVRRYPSRRPAVPEQASSEPEQASSGTRAGVQQCRTGRTLLPEQASTSGATLQPPRVCGSPRWPHPMNARDQILFPSAASWTRAAIT